MNVTFVAAIVMSCLFIAVLIGMWIGRLLPKHHMSSETKDTVKLAMGLVATMSALLLGLLVSSAKESYDATHDHVIQMASKVALLDRVLTIYGSEATEVHHEFRILAERWRQRMQQGETGAHASSKSDSLTGDSFYVAIQKLSPRDDVQRELKSQANSMAMQLAESRALLLAQSGSSISSPLLVMLVCWLMVIFLSFSIIAPRNALATFSLFVSALAVAGAIFLILELARPFDGLIRISMDPIVNVLSSLGKWGL
jgi:hypothetical protein